MRHVELEPILCFPVSSKLEASLILHLLPALGCKVIHPCKMRKDIAAKVMAWFAENGITLQRESLKSHVVFSQKGGPGQLRVNPRDLGIELDGEDTDTGELYMCGLVFTEASRGPLLIGLTVHMWRELARLLRMLTDFTDAVQEKLTEGLTGHNDGKWTTNFTVKLDIENQAHPHRNGHQ